MTFRPMKGVALEPGDRVTFPKLASFKINGIRAVWFGKEFMSSKMITLPNRELQKVGMSILGTGRSGFDGELCYGEPTAPEVYDLTRVVVMTRGATAHNLRLFAFDHAEYQGGYADRVNQLDELYPFVVRLDQRVITSMEELQEHYAFALASGYEGLVLRDPVGPYKHGRSTLREQYMLKLKPKKDAEARVIGFEELEHNANEAETNALGLTKRSSAKDGKVPMNTLGAVIVDWHGQPLNIGTFKGFTKAELQRVWNVREKYLGQLAKFQYFMIGSKGLPLHPRMIGWRHAAD